MLSYRKLAMHILGRPLYTERGNKTTRPASQRAAALALTAAIMTGAAFPAFAGIYYIGDGDITVTANEDGTAEVRRGDTVVNANDDNVVIKGGYSADAGQNTLEAVGGPAIAIDMGGDEITYPSPTPVVSWPDPADEAEEAPAGSEETPEEPSDTPEETPTEDVFAPEEEKPAEAEQPAAPAESEAVTLEARDAPAKAPAAAEKDDKDKADDKAITYEEKSPIQVAAEAVTKSVSNVIKIINNVKDKTLKVTLDDVNIDARRGEAAMSVSGEGDTTIELNGDNKLKSGSGHAGLEHNETAASGKLILQDEDNDGSLDATGGMYGAGIGGGSGQNGQVTITGGDINATGDNLSAGIGGGLMGSGNVTITGGTITATGGDSGAGIGGGLLGEATVTIAGDAVIKNASSVRSGAGIGGGMGSNGDVTISGNAKIENAAGDGGAAGIGGGIQGSGTVRISGNAEIDSAVGGDGAAGIGGGVLSIGNVTIEGNVTIKNAQGGINAAGIGGGAQAEPAADGSGNQITIRSNETGNPNVTATGGAAGVETVPGGAGIGTGGDSSADTDITIEGKVTIVAKAGEDNAAIGDSNGEQEFPGLAEGSSITRYDPAGNDISLPSDKGPIADTSSDGSATPEAPASALSGLTVTDKDGQRISYTSIRGNSVLTIRAERFTASLHASLSTLRQLRADGIETITFQTILRTSTLSVDELLAAGGEDAEAVLTHRFTVSTLTVG